MKQGKLLLVILSIICLLPGRARAQETYFCEFGLTGGCGFVMGDVNRMLFSTVQPMGGAFLKYKFNGHWEIRLQGEGGLLGVQRTGDKQFRRQIFGAGQLLGEFNFFNFGVKRWAEYRTWATPTLVAGVGFIGFKGGFTATIPVGIGVKLKLGDRINMGAYWMVSKTFTDKLDYVDNPIGLNKNILNNHDWYSTAQIYISVNFWKICAPCRDGVKVRRKY